MTVDCTLWCQTKSKLALTAEDLECHGNLRIMRRKTMDIRILLVGLMLLSVGSAKTNVPEVDPGRIGSLDPLSSEAGAGETDSCTASDKGPFFGGSSAECSLSCYANGGLEIQVDVADGNADAAGTFTCGGSSISCSGKQTCSSTGVSRSAGDGTCYGTSEEIVSDRVSVSCAAWDGPSDPAATGELLECLGKGSVLAKANCLLGTDVSEVQQIQYLKDGDSIKWSVTRYKDGQLTVREFLEPLMA